MDGADATQHYGDEYQTKEQSPSLLTIILDTNPAAWALLETTLPISTAIANLLVFINAHLACNYTNQVAVIASHCDKARFLYPKPQPQLPPSQRQVKKGTRPDEEEEEEEEDDEGPTNRNKRVKLNGSGQKTTNGTLSPVLDNDSNKYRPYRLIEEELTRSLRSLMTTTSPSTIQEKTSTMIAGALTLALSYINKQSQDYQERTTGVSSSLAEQSAASASNPEGNTTNLLQSRILVITLSPSADLAHQYIPIMNAIFACQRLNVPIDVLQLPLSSNLEELGSSRDSTQAGRSSTVFLQQASDATHGVFVAAKLSTPNSNVGTETITKIAQQSMLTYLLTAFLPTSTVRLHLITPTRVDVDFRAACFCHRDVISIGFVCSICLSIFCDQSLEALDADGCLTCGTKLSVRGEGVGGWAGGKQPVVVAPKKKKKKKGLGGAGTPRPGTPAA